MKDILIKLASQQGIPLNKVGNDQTNQGNADTVITNVINAVIGVLGLVCVIVMIVGGVTYMTSGGDAGKVKKGKDTILYGLIGLVVCALSFVLVNFVIVNILGN